ncbi:MAG TPA: heavy metal-associated domain-containing protein [Burkholderiaceae bacterium]|nr:heavy metal-associated domain-containing protein [Burkholderiaceae bacterium]
MKTTIAAIAFSLNVLSAGAQTSAPSTIKAEVNGMVCAFCAQGIEKKMKAMPQARDVLVNLDKRMVAVELKPGQTVSHDKIKEAIADSGYDVVKIETVAISVKDLKAQLK